MCTPRTLLRFGLSFILAAAVPLSASLSATPSSPVPGQVVTFVLSPQYSPDSLHSISWKFGDGGTATTTATVLSTTHAYASAGTFTASATYYYHLPSGALGTNTETKSLTVAALPRSVTFSPAWPNVGQTVTFRAVNFLTPGRISWNFGDGSAAVTGGSLQTYVYNTAGRFTVQARDQGGAAAPISVVVTVIGPRRTLTFSPVSPNVGQIVTFQALNFLTPNSISWNFGDGSAAVTGGSVQTHVYNAAGVFTVQARDQGGEADPVMAVVTVQAVLNRVVTFSPISPGVGQTVTFQASNFVTPNTIAWNFGDGSTIASGGPVQSHTYASAGTYPVQVRDQGGEAAPVSVNVTVVDNRQVTFSPVSPNVGETVAFQAQNFAAPNALSWNFGDGNTISSGASVQNHAFNSAGTFIVSVKDADSNTTPISVTVQVVNKRTIQVTPAEGGKTGQTIQFQAASFIAACIQWNFGDGSPAAQGTASQSHVFAKPGTFVVTATDQCGSSTWTATATMTIAPSEGPLAGFDVTFGLLRFEDGKTSIMVNQGTTGLAAFADLKYEGTGMLMVEWRVDGHPFRTDTAAATFGQSLTVNSGHLPGLPTAVPGPHTVEIRFLKPATSFALSPISYTVTTGKSDLKPEVDKATPAEVEAGKEYELKLEGKNLYAGTALDFGKGVGIVDGPHFGIGHTATLKVFVSPTAKIGDRLIHAGNTQGSNVGPGAITVTVPVIPKNVILPVCTKISDIPIYPIFLKWPPWWDKPQEWDNGVYLGEGPLFIYVPTVDDDTLLKWSLPFNYYDYVEVRFFKAKSKELIFTKRLEGPAESLRLSGDLLAEVFQALKASIPKASDNMTGAIKVSVQSPYPPGYEKPKRVNAHISNNILSGINNTPGNNNAAGQTIVQLISAGDYTLSEGEQLYAQGIADGADIAWQVAAFRVYPCVSDASSKNYFNQPVMEAVSEFWLLKLPHAFNGIACGPTGMQKKNVSIQPVNQTAAKRDQQSGNPGATGNANFVGDLFDLQGGFNLEGSPYSVHAPQGSPVQISNLFVDWGDGTPALPVWGKVEGADTKTASISLLHGLTWHKYLTEGAHTIRIFQLAEDDIQVPQDNFYAALGNAVTPAPTSSFSLLNNILGGPNAQEQPPSEADVLAGALSRAYMIYCTNVLISSYDDLCAKGPLHLASLEIVNFPEHDIKMPGADPSQKGITIRKDLIAAMSGIYAIALPCDLALFAHARLRYYGKGAIQLNWAVDGQWVQVKKVPLSSLPRKNLSAGTASDCTQALVSEYEFDSDAFPVSILGKHQVFVRAMVVPEYSLADMSITADKTVQKIGLNGPGAAGADSLAAGHGPAFRGVASTGSAGVDSFAAQLAIDAKNGTPVPQIGFLSPNPETGGGPAVVYLNDALGSEPYPVSPEGPWLADDSLASDTLIRSETKGYIVNEVGDVKFCQIRVPTSGGEFLVSDFESSLQLKGNIYDGEGTLIYKIRTSGGAVENAFLSGLAFKAWSIEETSGLLKNGSFDVAAQNAGALSFPANMEGYARRFKGQVDGSSLYPLIASFDLQLKGKHGTFLTLAEGPATGSPPEWKSVGGSLTAEGDWIASGQSLPKTAIGKTGFMIASPAVTFDFSTQAAGPGASGSAASPGWTGVLLGQALIYPATFGFTANEKPLTMTNTQPWRLEGGGLFGFESSGKFTSQVQEASVSFDHLDFKVSADVPTATYSQCEIHIPWINAVLKGDATIFKSGDPSGEYKTNWSGLTAAPVTLTYDDVGRISMVVSGLTWGHDSRGWRARGQAAVTLEAEGHPFALFALNGLNFGTDARAYFDGPGWGSTIPLSGSSSFGGATATLQNIQVEASDKGEDRLTFHVATKISLSPDSSFLSSPDVVIHYKISRAGDNYVGTGPWNAPFTTQFVFPLGSQEVSSSIATNYTYKPSSPNPDPSASGYPGISGPSAYYGAADIPNSRFGGDIDLAMFGCETIKGVFVLGYQDGKSFFLLFAKWPDINIPMSPVPLSILGIGGGFAYNFSSEVFRQGDMANAQPDLQGNAAFAAVMTVGTSDGFTIRGDGYLILGTDGRAAMGFENLQFMQQGNFGGSIEYYQGVVKGKGFGSLDLLGGLISFSLGTEAKPSLDFQLGGGDWHFYAGQEADPSTWITAKVWKSGSSSFLEIRPSSYRMGGSNDFYFGANAGIAKAYIKGGMGIRLGFGWDPFWVEGGCQAWVAAGACIWIPIYGDACAEVGATADIYAHSPNPTVLRGKCTIKICKVKVHISVEF
jgi:PKD repeat protein